MLPTAEPAFMDDEELRIFADSVDRFFAKEAPLALVEQWRDNGVVDRDFWTKAARMGMLGISLPSEYGGGGGDFRHDLVLVDRVVRRDVNGFAISLHNGIVGPYIVAHGTVEQKHRWIPRLCNGELLAAVAMSEPGTGSDLQRMRTTAVHEGAGYRINGQKTFISNGQLANFIVVAAKTDPSASGRGISLFVVETDRVEGFRRGRRLDKIGNEAQDTSELFFDDVLVPGDALLGGEEGKGFRQLMAELPRERIIIAVQAMAMIEAALDETITYTKEREVFGESLFTFQNTQFKLAEMKTEATVARTFLNETLRQVLLGELSTEQASMAKYWITDLQGRIVDQCVQLFGGYGYMNEYRIARMYKDARISRIYGGTNEIMKLVIAKAL